MVIIEREMVFSKFNYFNLLDNSPKKIWVCVIVLIICSGSSIFGFSFFIGLQLQRKMRRKNLLTWIFFTVGGFMIFYRESEEAKQQEENENSMVDNYVIVDFNIVFAILDNGTIDQSWTFNSRTCKVAMA